MLVLKTRTSKDSELGSQVVAPDIKTRSNLCELIHIQDRDALSTVGPWIYENKVRHLFIDIETTGLDVFSDSLVLLQIMAGPRVFLIEISKIGIGDHLKLQYQWLKDMLEDQSILKVLHNAKFDLKFLKYHLFQNSTVRFRNIFDTCLSEKLLRAGISKKGEAKLEAVATKYLDIDMDKSEQTSFGDGQDLTREQIEYAKMDVQVLKPIFEKQRDLLAQNGLVDTALLEFSVVPAVVDIELKGLKLDMSKIESMRKSLLDQKAELEEKLEYLTKDLPRNGESPAINFGSPKQVKSILNQLGCPVESTSKAVLETIKHPFAKTLLEYRTSSKLISSFVNKLPGHIHEKTGRIHPDFFQIGTQTGRFSCARPNLQQIPKKQEWRDLFRAPKGYKIITADYSQIELRILAELSQDEAFLKAFRSGKDMHAFTASQMFSVPFGKVSDAQRGIGKTINFGICYGMSAQGLSDKSNISIEQAEGFIDAYFEAYPQVAASLNKFGRKTLDNLISESMLGRKRYFKQAGSFGAEKAMERQGRNSPIQATCADILKKAIAYLHDEFQDSDAWIINLIHDEIVVEVKEDIIKDVTETVRNCMERAGKDFLKSVPVVVDITVDDVWRK